MRDKMGRRSEAAVAGEPRVNRASQGPLSEGFGDLEDRMIQHPGIRWHRADCVNNLGPRLHM